MGNPLICVGVWEIWLLEPTGCIGLGVWFVSYELKFILELSRITGQFSEINFLKFNFPNFNFPNVHFSET